MRQSAVASAISTLLTASSPSHISGFVVAVVVRKSVQGMRLGWPIANIGEKCGERIQPCVTDSNATPAIIGIRLQSRIGASRLHGLPCSILRGVACVLGAMTRSVGWLFTLQETNANRLGLSARFTHTIPNAVAEFVFSTKTDDGKVSECVPSEVLESGAGGNRMGFSHESVLVSDLSTAGVGVRCS